MKFFVRYIVDIIISLLKRAWYHARMEILKTELKKEKEEVKDAIEESDKIVDDFESSYKLYKRSEDKKGREDS